MSSHCLTHTPKMESQHADIMTKLKKDWIYRVFTPLLLLTTWSNVWGQPVGQPVDSDSEKSRSADIQIDYNVVYGQPDEPMHRADILKPSTLKDGEKLPGLLLIHGGAWTLGDKRNDARHAKRLASLGFVVMSINYRLAPKHPFPAQIDDCRLALKWLHEHADELQVDSSSIGSWGYSAGGHLAALLATDPRPDVPRLKACVAGGAPCDLTSIPLDSNLLEPVFGGPRRTFPKRYVDASPITHVSPDDPPIFLFHGSKDWLVPSQSSISMKEALQREGVAFEYLVVPDKAHLMTFIDREATEKSYQFLIERMR